jgi:hypothetical protein
VALALIVLGVWFTSAVGVATTLALIGLGLSRDRVPGEVRLPRGQTTAADSPEVVPGRCDADRRLLLPR